MSFLDGPADKGDDREGASQSPVEDATAAPAPPRGRRWRRATRLVGLAVAIGLVFGIGGGSAALWLRGRSLEQNIGRVDPFAGMREGDRPTAAASVGENYLVVGLDTPPGEEAAGSRTDTIILVHISEDRRDSHLISIPRDTWASVPSAATEADGGKAKINSAYAFGGTPLLVATVESFTGVRIDHVVLLDFAGFEKVIDALDGVTVSVQEEFATARHRYTKGTWHMDGETALDFARQRSPFQDGDFTRIRHQQEVFRAVLQRATDRGLLANPAKLNEFLNAVTGAVTVDRDLPLFGTIWNLRHLKPGQVVAITSPTARTGFVGDQSVVFPDEKAASELFSAVRTDTVGAWLEAHPQTD